MSLHRATRDLSAPTPPSPAARRSVGPVVVFICAVLIAGMTCILYLWQQSQIVAGTQDIARYDRQVTLLAQQRDDLLAQEQRLTSVTHVVAQANRMGMIQGDPHQFVAITNVPSVVHISNVAQAVPRNQPAVVLPATNAAITEWWQSAWDGLYSLIH